MMTDLFSLVQRFSMSSNIAEHNTTGIQKKELAGARDRKFLSVANIMNILNIIRLSMITKNNY